MHDESTRKPLEPQLRGLEAALRSMTPGAPALDRDQLFYQAGWAACERELAQRERPTGLSGATSRWMWPLATAAMALVSASLVVVLAVQNEPRERIVYAASPEDATPEESREPFSRPRQIAAAEKQQSAEGAGGGSAQEATRDVTPESRQAKPGGAGDNGSFALAAVAPGEVPSHVGQDSYYCLRQRVLASSQDGAYGDGRSVPGLTVSGSAGSREPTEPSQRPYRELLESMLRS